jgi:branched-chain amino acid transport system ATP-binding protein
MRAGRNSGAENFVRQPKRTFSTVSAKTRHQLSAEPASSGFPAAGKDTFGARARSGRIRGSEAAREEETVDELERWLAPLDLAQLAPALRANDVDLKILPGLSEADLDRLGLSLGQRKKLLKAAACLPKPSRLAGPGTAQASSLVTAVTVQMSVEGVSKRFGGVTAVDGVSIDVPKGRILSIIGPNGAGKTSLLNMISGFYKPDTGRITLEGRDITSKRPSAVAALGIARTFQNIALFSGLSVLDNLMLGRHVRMSSGVFSSVVYWGLAQREEVRHREACEEIIEFLKLQDLRKQPTAALAYGLRKRVELGRALAQDPKVLLLDEPMGGMNQDEREDMARYVLDVSQERGMTVVLIEHDMGVVMDISNHVVVLDGGRMIAEGSPAAVQSNPAVIAAYLGAARRKKA